MESSQPTQPGRTGGENAGLAEVVGTAARVRDLGVWLEQNKFWWDREAIAFRPHLRGAGLGIGVVALRPLKKDQLLCVLPKEAVLSVRNTAVADIINKADLPNGVTLAFALMHELSLGSKSKWSQYLNCIPPYEPLPLFWSDAECSSLQGTELSYILPDDQEKLNTDYEDHVVPLAEAHKHRTGGKAVMTFELFKRASSLVASRAFGVDSYHGDAMLPIADLFNHTGNEHVHIESDGDACEECGSPDPCPHRPEELDVAGSVNEKDEFEGNSTAKRPRTSHRENQEEQREEDDESCPRPKGVIPSKYALDIVMIRDAEEGEEIYNTYGPLPNVVLLNKHGFVEIPNLNDCVSVDEAIIRAVAAKCLGNDDAATKRLDFCKTRKKVFGEELCYNFHFNGTAEKQLLWVVFILLAPPATCAKLSKAKPALLFKQLRSIDKKELVRDAGVRAVLVALAQARLSLYPPSTIEEDRSALEQAKTENNDTCLVWSLMLRVAEKELLGRAIRRYAPLAAPQRPV